MVEIGIGHGDLIASAEKIRKALGEIAAREISERRRIEHVDRPTRSHDRRLLAMTVT